MLPGQQLTKILVSEDIEARQLRWRSLISGLEDGCDDDSDDEDGNGNVTVQGVVLNGPGGMADDGILSMGTEMSSYISPIGAAEGYRVTAPALPPSRYQSHSPNRPFSSKKNFSFPSWSTSHSTHSNDTEAPTLRDWIASHWDNNFNRSFSRDVKPVMEISERRKYLETSVQILHSLVGKIIGGYTGSNTGGTGRDEIYAHPNLITLDNITFQQKKLLAGEVSADFVESGDSIFYSEGQADDHIRKKYLAMDALGRLAYEIFTMGEGLEVFRGRGGNARNCLSNALSLQDKKDADAEDEIIDMLRKSARTTTSEQETNNNGGIIPAMLDSSVPFPLCRFVSDLLLDDEDSVFGRSQHSFSNFADVTSDLKQMVNDPDSFLHNSHPDRWKLVFGNKLYGRDTHTKIFMDVANRVGIIRSDPLFSGLISLVGNRKELVMVLGHSGSGKSRFVRLGGTLLEKRGWRFLKCKFDRVAHPEPLSILAYAFDDCFGSFASCPIHGVNTMDNHQNNSNGHLAPYPSSSVSSECNCSESHTIRKRLESTFLPEGLGILAKHIPSLRLVAKNVPPPSDNTIVNESIMHTLFGKLIQVLSSKQTPVLFFIDDLQWVDPLSLELLAALIKGARPDLLPLSSTANKKQNDELSEVDANVMFVGSYRDNEVDDDHPLTKVLHKFHLESSVNVTNISLSGFTIDTLNEMLSESLHIPVRRVRSLSEMVIQKTDGQPLHVIEFVQALTMDNLLTHSFERGWEWDADSIDIFPITDSVAELFAFKLRRLPREILLGLQIMSCFGSQIDQHILRFVADYDGEDSVDIAEAIRVATSQGLIEQASSLVSFAHDMIQKATIDSVRDKEALVALLRKLTAALIKNASAVNELDSVLYVAVDLINRIGSDATSRPEERALFAKLNSRAGSKAIKVPDFAGAAKYAENGIAFLNDNHWEDQYDLSLRLHETAVLSHFSSLKGDRDRLTLRINAVFDHAEDFSDQFTTRCVWIKLLSMSDVSKAIEESLHALERLGEPLDLTGIDSSTCRDELVKLKEQFKGERKEKFLSSNRLLDENKIRVMKIFSSLIIYYHMKKSRLGSYISCRMMEMSTNHGHCEHSVFGAAVFASALVNVLDEIDEGSAWGRLTLSLMSLYDKEYLIPSIYGSLYGIVFVWKEPLQSTLEPLALGIRRSFEMGNVEFAMVNTIYYNARSFNCGKNIRVLIGEVEALARQNGNHFGNDTSSDTPVYSPLLQFYLTPLYNTLRHLEGKREDYMAEEEEALFPLDKVKIVNNDDILKFTLNMKEFACFHTILSFEIVKAFAFRDMANALKCADLYFEHFESKDLRLLYTSIYHVFYDALINFYFARQTGKQHQLSRGKNALAQIREWLKYSDWNFLNKLLLVEAESYYTQKDFDNAAACYETAIKAAREHKFIHEEAITSELAGIFFLEIGLLSKAKSYFIHSIECFKRWGAFAVARRVETFVASEFGSDLMQLGSIDDSLVAPSAFFTEIKLFQEAPEQQLMPQK